MMIFVDVYREDNRQPIASFELEYEWQYEDVVAFEDKLTEQGIKYFEITTYQKED